MRVLAISVGAFILAALIVFILSYRWIRSRNTMSRAERNLEVTLMNMVFGSRQHLDRVVAAEERKVPGKPRSWYLKRAIERLKKDRR